MSKRYTGGIVSATKPTTTSGESGTASGMWEIEQQGRLQAAGLWPIPYVPKYVEEVFSTYVYKGNGNSIGNDVPNGIVFGGVPTNGTILHFTGDALSDSAPVPCPFSNVGASVNTTTKKYGTGSLYFNGTSTNIITANSAGLRFGTGDFTVECWVYNVSGGNQGIFHLGDNFGSGCVFVNMYPSGFFQWGWDGSYAGSVGSFPSSQWIHVALVRQSGVMKLYVNGTQVGSNNTFAGNINLGRIWVGNYYDTNYAFNGYIDDFRVSNKAVYTANFTPPAQALPLDTIVSGTNYGGMTWMKCRSTAYAPVLYDTLRGGTNTLRTNTTDGNRTDAGSIAFNTSGWCVNTTNAGFNAINDTYVSWSFRRQAKFFDVVTYTGNGVAGRTVPHNLGSVPGCIFVKMYSASGWSWRVYHRSMGNTQAMYLDLTNSASTSASFWNNTTPTSTQFTVGDDGGVNGNGISYVAYLFAHDAGGFGDSGADSLISCGSWTASSTAAVPVNLGWEPQYVLVKNSSATQNWFVWDTMRGMPVDIGQPYLNPNSSSAESLDTYYLSPTPTGFTVRTNALGTNGDTYIYVAIRRGPMRTPTSGTSVFEATTYTGRLANANIGSMGPIDAAIIGSRDGYGTSYSQFVFDRLRGSAQELGTANTDAEVAFSNTALGFDTMAGWNTRTSTTSFINSSGYNYVSWNFKRARGFFDQVCYTGTGATLSVNHSLGAVPELMIVRVRNKTTPENWCVYSQTLGAGYFLALNSTAAKNGSFDSTRFPVAPTSSVFTVGSDQDNGGAFKYVAYLFASCPGVSKVGSYTGTGAAQTINCGFTGGARFVLIKRTDSTGAWYVWDTARGLISGNDPYLLLNSNSAEVTNTDYISPQSVGFGLTASAPAALNAAGGTYIFLAIA